MDIAHLHAIYCLGTDGRLTYRYAVAHRVRAGDEAGHTNHSGYRVVSIKARRVMAHRAVFAMTHGRWPEGEIDHINGDKLDNRPENLREARRGQNAKNVGKSAANTSGIKGVSWSKGAGKWLAQITCDRKNIYLGVFANCADAGRAYEDAAARLFGEFRRAA